MRERELSWKKGRRVLRGDRDEQMPERDMESIGVNEAFSGQYLACEKGLGLKMGLATLGVGGGMGMITFVEKV